MTPHPTDHLGLLRIPGPGLSSVAIRFAPLTARDNFDPATWPQHPLTASAAFIGWWEIDLDLLALSDGDYEYEFVLNGGSITTADPYAETITRFGGYRGVFTMGAGKRTRKPFDWTNEFTGAGRLPQNNQIVIYEMPIKWMASGTYENPLVELGTIDKVIFEHLDDLAAMGINCIELLPVQDSPQTLNWGYGTRFFFAPDYDVATPVDLKFFIKVCHQKGVRVLLDVVMNMFAPPCPLAALATPWFYEAPSQGRTDYSQDLFHYSSPSYDNYYAAREFLCEMAGYWVAEYHVDGYRIDDFNDINNWDFVQQFHDRATARSNALFPAKSFLVIAEDSARRFSATAGNALNGRVVVDAIWNFGYRDESRRLLTNAITTNYGQPSRSVRVQHLISKDGVWNGWGPGSLDPGYADLACSVDYITSHDVADGPRLMNVILGSMLGTNDIAAVSTAVDNADKTTDTNLKTTVQAAFRRVFGGFAMLMTSVGIPMFLAGEEFGDVHDADYIGVNPKQEDPVQWNRAAFTGNAALKTDVAKLIQLRISHPALQRNEVVFFYFHPRFDDNVAPRVFAYCRTNGQPLGTSNQVIVIANMGPDDFANYDIPDWRWSGMPLNEIGTMTTGALSYSPLSGTLSLALSPFAVRVLTT